MCILPINADGDPELTTPEDLEIYTRAILPTCTTTINPKLYHYGPRNQSTIYLHYGEYCLGIVSSCVLPVIKSLTGSPCPTVNEYVDAESAKLAFYFLAAVSIAFLLFFASVYLFNS